MRNSSRFSTPKHSDSRPSDVPDVPNVPTAVQAVPTTVQGVPNTVQGVPLISVVMVAALVILFFAALFLGTLRLNPGDVLSWLTGREISPEIAKVLLLIRLPRAIACVICGGALALSGYTLQTSMNNALVSPGIIGINSGAGFFLVISAVLFPFSLIAKSIAVLAGALAAAFITILLSLRTSASKLTIVLAGVAVSSFCAAGSDVLVTLFPDVIFDRTAFFIGSFSSIDIKQIQYALPFVILGAAGIFFLSSALDQLILGDDVAASLGVRVIAVRIASVVFSAFLAAGAVEICGLLSFVGLVVPHIIRRILKGRSGFALRSVVVLFAGADLVLFCDILARSLFPPYELPVGLFLSLIGAPYFLYLLLNRKRSVA